MPSNGGGNDIENLLLYLCCTAFLCRLQLHFPTTVYPETLSVEPEAGFQFTHLKEVDTSSTYIPNKEPDISTKRKLEQESVAQRPSKRSAIDIVSESRILEHLDPNSTSFDFKPSLVFDASEVLVAIEDPYCEDYGNLLKSCIYFCFLITFCKKIFRFTEWIPRGQTLADINVPKTVLPLRVRL